jgi:hypothetical protein
VWWGRGRRRRYPYRKFGGSGSHGDLTSVLRELRRVGEELGRALRGDLGEGEGVGRWEEMRRGVDEVLMVMAKSGVLRNAIGEESKNI